MAIELYNTKFFTDANLLYYYRFEGNSNNSYGAKPSNHGTDTSITYGTSYGKFNQGANFNGSSSTISFGSLAIAPLDLTISLWVNTTVNTTYKILFRSRALGDTGVGFLSDGNNLFFQLDDQGPLGTHFETNVNFCSSAYIATLGWTHLVGTYKVATGIMTTYMNGNLIATSSWNRPLYNSPGFYLGSFNSADYFTGNIDDLAIFTKALTASEVKELYGISPNKSSHIFGKKAFSGQYPPADDSSLDTNLIAWNNLKVLLDKSVNGGQCFSQDIPQVYDLIYGTLDGSYWGGVLAPSGDIHFVPYYATVGQKVSASGVVSTYSLVYTVNGAYSGGVLTPNGDIHFIPIYANRGQKISSSGVVSTYSLVYTASGAYSGGVLAPNGDIHFIPYSANRGQKISSSGVVSTYSLVYTASGAYCGGVLAPNGDIHFVKCNASVGQKISASGVVSTYSLVYTSGAYASGVLTSNGDIHFMTYTSTVGQKISSSGVVSTYSLVYTASGAYSGGVLAPNGDMHLVPHSAPVGQKISANGVVSTYSLAITSTYLYQGGVLTINGDIHFVPFCTTWAGEKISTLPAIPFDHNVCLSPFFNKL